MYFAGSLKFDLKDQNLSIIESGTASDNPDSFPTLDQVEESHIRRALKQSAGKIHGPGGAGELLDLNPNTLRNRMKKLGIKFGKNL